MLQGYASFYKLMGENFPFSSFGKCSVLFFDEIVLGVPDENVYFDTLTHTAEKYGWSSRTFDELLEVLVPIQRHKPDYRLLSFDRHVEPPLGKAVTDFIDENFRERGIGQDHPAYWREYAWMFLGMLERFGLWLELLTSRPTVYLPEQYEHQILKRLLKKPDIIPAVEVCYDIVSERLPNFDDFSWEKIVDLRRHEFFDQFRKKIVEIQRLMAEGDTRSANEITEELMRRDIQRLVKISRPNTLGSMLGAVVGLAPLPSIPDKIVSAISGGRAIAHDIEKTKTAGWVYFLEDAAKL